MKQFLEQQTWPGRDKELNVDIIDDNKITVSCNLNYEQTQSLQNLNLDVSAMITSVINNEIKISIDKHVSKKVFNSNNNKQINSIDELIQKIKYKKGFLITNIQIGSLISDLKYFNPVIFNTPQTLNYPGSIYFLGKINDLEIYIDPNMSWDDKKAAHVTNNFYNFDFDNSMNISVISESTKPPKMVGTVYVDSVDPKNQVYFFNKDISTLI